MESVISRDAFGDIRTCTSFPNANLVCKLAWKPNLHIMSLTAMIFTFAGGRLRLSHLFMIAHGEVFYICTPVGSGLRIHQLESLNGLGT
jgi:hypothetical protein